MSTSSHVYIYLYIAVACQIVYRKQAIREQTNDNIKICMKYKIIILSYLCKRTHIHIVIYDII